MVESARATRPAGTVQSLDRALDLIEALAQADRALGVGELAEGTRLPQGTVHRLLQTLQARGFVRRTESRKYSLGTGAFRLGDAAQRALVRTARPYLADLVRLSGETANLAVLEGDDVVYVEQVSSPHTLRMFAEVGRHVPPHSTAVGKVLLAALPRDRAVALLRRTGLPARTPATITTLDAFVAELDLVRERGWASDEQEQETGIRCVAVPVGRDGRVVAAASDGLVEAMQRAGREAG
jgi:IclR family acetate operon transcriptional repressor